jgi:two-component system NtrC family sensor kinase
VNAVVRDVVALMGHAAAREGRIHIDMRLTPHLAPTVVSTDELKQVVINLLANATQSIGGPGRILITTRPSRGDRITLALADTGAGIPRHVMPRIFDPFFTTKTNGEGTGLGLSVVYGIVTKYAGTIDVKSVVGRGSRFCLGLPVAHEERSA